jgi:hypothetical protein
MPLAEQTAMGFQWLFGTDGRKIHKLYIIHNILHKKNHLIATFSQVSGLGIISLYFVSICVSIYQMTSH